LIDPQSGDHAMRNLLRLALAAALLGTALPRAQAQVYPEVTRLSDPSDHGDRSGSGGRADGHADGRA
jgi:hypothetical protein